MKRFRGFPGFTCSPRDYMAYFYHPIYNPGPSSVRKRTRKVGIDISSANTSCAVSFTRTYTVFPSLLQGVPVHRNLYLVSRPGALGVEDVSPADCMLMQKRSLFPGVSLKSRDGKRIPQPHHWKKGPEDVTPLCSLGLVVFRPI